MKPGLFNPEMVRAILEDRKTVTRRVVKPQPVESPALKMCPDDVWRLEWWNINEFHSIKVPICIGDILYVRETWCINNITPHDPEWNYKADYDCLVKPYCNWKWHPSIHMPREAARIFLRATDVKVQRVQDITDAEARKEGCKDRDDFHRVWNNCYSKPQPVKIKGIIDHYESYPWEDIRETRTYRGKPWYVIGNPWTWGIEFERCEKPEGD